ncbi:MAG: hypothetical protein A2052_03730 [Deltaproteobacteria bacterium GWA2_54_12]|nr:MAG: hypothetical protein A2052_03730 [Deltaproteobacteria bacterium GWA2_54_12]
MAKLSLKAPQGLSKAAVSWWGKLLREYQITDNAGLLLLEQALRSFDRAEEARLIIDKEGAVIRDRFNQARTHPACQVERDSRAAVVKTLAALGIDGGPVDV